MLRDCWYPACASSRLEEGPIPVKILDSDLVLFRDGRGWPRALLDRCCHRGVRLSLGTVFRGSVVCGYHGWQYEGGGRCAHVPSLVGHEDVPTGFSVPAFPCSERDSYVWVWMGAGAPNPPEPPAIPDFERCAWEQGSSSFACAAMKLIENNLDWCHPAFTHEGTHPLYFAVQARGFREYQFEVRTTEQGLAIFFPPTSRADDPIPGSSPTI